MGLKPWREVAVPHSDVLKGTFQQAEFAADLSRVHDKTAAAEYQDAALFFQRTFITEGMRLLLDSVVKRLAGKGGDPVIQLQTAFGGGKTHTMLAVYHLANGTVPATNLQGIPAILESAGIVDLQPARIVVLDGIRQSPNQPAVYDGVAVKTLWGELAWQLGKAEAYELVRDADQSGTSPGKAVLEQLLSRYAPCVILIDELVAYVRQFEEGKALSGGSFDSNLSFIQALTEALKAVPTAILLASLPESDKEAGSQRGVKALGALAHYFGRVQALWKPVSSSEAFEIVRRRLFASIGDQLAAEEVCRAFADLYVGHAHDFPHETQESRYHDRLLSAYPIHPEVFDRLYEDWSSIDNFQRTRGVLKLMAKVIHRLWNANNTDLLIMPGSLPLYDADVRNEAIYYLPQGWDPVLEKDIDGERAETTEIERRDPRLGSVQACRRAARAIFLGSAPTNGGQVVRGIELERVVLGVAQPGQQPSLFKDALRRLGDRLQYLNSGNNRFWFDVRANLRREMEDRKRRFQDKEDVFPSVRDRLQRSITSVSFDAVHVFTPSADVPDDWMLRLVVLPPDAAFSRSGQSLAIDRATEILKGRGDQPRFKQNRVLFVAADFETVSRLKDQVRSMLAWQSIVNDVKDLRLNLDQLQARQAERSLGEAVDTVRRTIREAYKWLLAPSQEARPGKGISDVQWEHFALNPGTANFGDELDRVLKENELVIGAWAPVHLATVLRNWFWKPEQTDVGALGVWQQTCHQLYLPRLRDDRVFQSTLAAGAESRDFFGLAQGKDSDGFVGFVYGNRTTPILDSSLLLIEPSAAASFANSVRERSPTSPIPGGGGAVVPPPVTPPSAENGSNAQPPTPSSVKRRFYASTTLDPVLGKKGFNDLYDELVMLFTTKPGVSVQLRVEIEADAGAGVFDDATQRAARENAAVLKFSSAEFEE